MGDMQKKVLGFIKGEVEKAGFDFVRNGQWANTGNVFVQEKDGFDNLFSFHYDFQDTTMHLHFYPKGVKPFGACGFTPKECIGDFYVNYSDDQKMHDFLEWVKDVIRGKGSAKRLGGMAEWKVSKKA